ncbi:uncharacterized protein AMSG_09971 [Thecamonas trahens ATCC 50062]|uniref:Calponin-homology (CH) domain-containing protein n=1 Tax=Thecamonas trahens ATCC 50062 TaxID=461836 RepID=A0A0L0DPK1_THETB|nr:hypothetical protein AMSG_09971 [Thecamonas trahens ATCC 50062]KNC54185.1 hypothetical protein AMSG_09971 [Thecamonas trahens ATCC 50062]|eukprot:XP_013754001.1 hypothetical protein AMSG_09971 [Thecamonas trahens ATCC 50062]
MPLTFAPSARSSSSSSHHRRARLSPARPAPATPTPLRKTTLALDGPTHAPPSSSASATRGPGTGLAAGDGVRAMPARAEANHGDAFPIAVAPDEVVFPDVAPDTLYIFNLRLQNVGPDTVRVCLAPPASAKFSFADGAVTSFSLAPGLSHYLDLQFRAEETTADVHDAVRVSLACGDALIPVRALIPRPVLGLSALAVDFGTLPPAVPATRTVTLTNSGAMDGQFRLALPEPGTPDAEAAQPFSITPSRGVVSAGGSLALRVAFKGPSVGVFRAVLPLHCIDPGSRLPVVSSLEVTASVVKQALTLYTANGAAVLDVVDFGAMYYGQSRVVSGLLTNNGPLPVSFAVIFGKDRGGATSVMTTASDLVKHGGARAGLTESAQDAEKFIMTLEPSRGTLAPGQSLTMTCTFAPPATGATAAAGASLAADAPSPSLYFKVPYFIEMVETGAKTKVTLKGEAHVPSLAFSATIFQFGPCPINSHLDMEFTVKNTNEELPATVAFGKLAHFAVSARKLTLLPLQTKSLLLRFAPKQYGEFSGLLTIRACAGTYSRTLSVSGLCTTAARLPPALAALPPSAPHLVHPDDYARALNRQPSASSRRTKPAPPPSALVDKRFSYDEATAARIAAAKSTYNGYLKESAAARVAATKARDRRRSVDFLNGVDLGMVPGSGLEEPQLALPPAREKLYLEHVPGDSDAVSYLKNLKLHSGDEFIATKFPAEAAHPAQKKECTSVLSTAELRDIVRGPAFIDFGTVSVFSANAKSFNVTNNLDQAVSVAVFATEHEELSASTAKPQVIPPGATAGFDIRYTSLVPQKFNRMIQYMVNGHHAFSFSVKAESIATRLALSHSFLEFHFPPDVIEPRVTEVITMTNPGNAPAEFRWTPVNTIESSSPVFDIVPLTGAVPPASSLNCHITYTPDASPEDVTIFKLSVKGGSELSLTCRGAIGVGKASFSTDAVDFGVVSVGMVDEATVYLLNVGRHDVFYTLDSLASAGDSFGDLMITSPTSGRIPVGSRAKVTVSFAPTQPQDLRTRLSAAIRGAGRVSLVISASAEVPSLSIEEPAFDFGQVYIGATTRLPVTLANTGRIPASCYLDLSEEPEFTVDIPAEYVDMLDATGDAPIMMVADIAGPAGSVFDQETLANTIGALASNIYKLTLEPGTKLSFELVFRPIDPFELAFQLPLRMISIEDAGDLRRVVTATALRAPLDVSETNYDFGEVVILKPGALPYTHTLVLTNQDSRGFRWSFELSHDLLADDTFVLEPTEGHLNPGQRASVRVSFTPLASTAYLLTLPITIDGGEAGLRTMTITTRGRGVYPNLTFLPATLHLPVVPLGFTSRASVTISGQGYDALDLVYELPLDSRSLPLAVEFPGATALTRDASSTTIEVTFSASSAMAFATTIDFIDSDGVRFPLHVTGITDNCFLTLFPFVAPVRSDFAFVEGSAASPPRPPLSRSGRSSTGDSAPLSPGPASVLPLDLQQPLELGGSEGAAGKTIYLRLATLTDRQVFENRMALLPQYLSRSASILESGRVGLSGGGGSGLVMAGGPASGGPVVSFQLDDRGSPDGRGSSLADVEGVDSPLGALLRQAADVICTWLSARILPLPIKNFPDDAVREDGRPIAAAFKALTGKKLPGRVGKRSAANKVDYAHKLFRQYANLTRIIRAAGGLLTQVEPEDFLTLAECDRVRTAALKKADPEISQETIYAERDLLERAYPFRSLAAWTYTTLQMIRCYVLPRVTLDSWVERIVALQSPPTDLAYMADLTDDEALEFGLPASSRKATKRGRSAAPTGRRDGPPEPSKPGQKARKAGRAGRRGPGRSGRRSGVTPGGGSSGGGSGAPTGPSYNGVPYATVLASRKLTEASLDASNVYSRSEMLLLEWASVCYELVYPTSARPLLNFDIDFADGVVLAAILVVYIPQLSSSWLSSIYQETGTSHHIESNAEKVLNAFREASLDFPLDEGDIVAPDPINIMLLLAYLYEVLPAYQPLAKIKFSGALHEELSKAVVLRNPSSTAAIIYSIWLTGSSDFYVKQSSIRLEPSETASLPVFFESKFSAVRRGRLTLIAKKAGAAQGSILAFELESDINDLKPVEVMYVTSRCYENETVKITFENTSPFNAQFALSLSQSMVTPILRPESEAARAPSRSPVPASAVPAADVDAYLADIDVLRSSAAGSQVGGGGGGGVASALERNDVSGVLGFPADPFWCRLAAELAGVGVLELAPSEKVTIPIEFLPFLEGEYVCRLQFVDERAGEFVYEVRGRAMLPQPIDVRRWSTQVKTPLSKTFVVHEKNPGLERAKGVVLERLRLVGSDMNVLRAVTMAMRAPMPRRQYAVTYVMPKVKGAERALAGPDVVWVDSSGSGASGRNSDGGMGLGESLTLVYAPTEQGIIRARLLLRSMFDVRVYDFEGSATAPPERASLQLSTPARTTLVQPIPLVRNEGDNPINVRAVLSGPHFRGPTMVVIPAGEAAEYELTFSPPVECAVSGKLVLTNTETSLSSIYMLEGEGTSPLAEDHLVVQVQARKTTGVSFPLANTMSRSSISVTAETDLAFASGPASVSLEPGARTQYELVIAPTRSGKTLGQVTFSYPDGSYVWYTIEVEASPPDCEGLLEASAELRSRTTLRVQLKNVLGQDATFSVTYKGHGLSGPSEFRVGAQSKGEYLLQFVPLKEGKHAGEVTFTHEELGEYTYVLELEGKPVKAVALEPLSCEVGKVARTSLTLRSPLRVQVMLMISNSNPHNFRLEPEMVVLSPLTPTQVYVEYHPSAIGQAQTATIKLSHPETGSWVFEARGTGSPPTKMDAVTVTERIRFHNSSQLNFVNPFEHELRVSVALVTPEDVAAAEVAASAAAARAAAEAAEREALNSAGSAVRMLAGRGGTRAAQRQASLRSRAGTSLTVRAGTSLSRVGSSMSLLRGTGSARGSDHGGASESEPSGDEVAGASKRVWALPQPGNFTLPGFGVLRIPYTFSPTEMRTYEAELVVRAEPKTRGEAGGKPIEWVYPLRGIAEAPVASEVYELRARSREKADEIFDFYATGLGAFDGLESFWHVLNVPVEHEAAVRASLTVTPVVNTLRRSTEPLRFRFEFEPSLPFETDVQFLVHKKSGGLWRYTLHLTADEPDVDDVFSMDAILHKTTAIAFRQANYTAAESAPFTAYFTPESSFDFTVEPSEGELPPASGENAGGEGGQRFVVYCQPSSYGRVQRGWLVIKTAAYQWTYEINGQPPEYVPPSDSTRRVPLDNKISPQMRKSLLARKSQKKNFMRANVARIRGLASANEAQAREERAREAREERRREAARARTAEVAFGAPESRRA